MNFAAARRNMVQNQVLTNQVTDARLLDVLNVVPREVFVPDELQPLAYVDGDVALGEGRALMQPAVFARLLQAAEIQPHEVVLDVGCATGYSSAVLGRLASTVVALEEEEGFRIRAAELLAKLEADNVALVAGPLARGDSSHGPYDVIVVEGALPRLPQSLCEQLAEGGRLVAVIGESITRATLCRRVKGIVSSRVLFDVRVTSLPGFAAQPCFSL